MRDVILTINAGSSSIKFAVYDFDSLTSLCRGSVAGFDGDPRCIITGPLAVALERLLTLQAPTTHERAIAWLLAGISERLPDLTLVAAGHRVVHGGTLFRNPVLIDNQVLSQLEALVVLAPNHEPHNIAAIRAVARHWPGVPQLACFDTAFHQTQPRLAQLFGLPREMSEAGILRYGFHGLSYEYIAGILPSIAGPRADGKVVVAHLGNGSSMCAMIGLRSVATSMGYTSLDGLMMGTRSGSIDPGVVLYLLQQKSMTAAQVSDLLFNRSGLLGVSGISSDVRNLEASKAPEAAEALELFAFRANRELGALVAVLGGLDILVFTAGIGEHSAGIRARICENAQWAGITLDPTANARGEEKISAARSTVDVFVIATDEETTIAQSAKKLLAIPAN